MLVSDDFVHLCAHSNYSLLEGASSPAELLASAKASSMRALALTDTNALYGVPIFYKLARELGIKPIIGCEIDAGVRGDDPLQSLDSGCRAASASTENPPQSPFGKGGRNPFPPFGKVEGSPFPPFRKGGRGGICFRVPQCPNSSGLHGRDGGTDGTDGTGPSPCTAQRVVLLARNHNGYANLCRIVTERRLVPNFSIERALERYGNDLYVLCRDAAQLAALKSIVEPQRLYLQISEPGWIVKSTLASTSGGSVAAEKDDSVGCPRESPLAKGDSGGCLSPPNICEVPLSKGGFRGLLVAAFDVRYAKPQQRPLLHLLLAIKNGRLLSEQVKETPAEMTHLKSAEEVRDIFGRATGPIENAARIAADCNVELRSGAPVFPKSERGTRNAELEMRNSEIRNPKSAIRNPKSAIQNPKSEIENPQSAIRIGLAEVKGLSQQTVLTILKERERACFSSLADFLARVRRATQPEVENLILCGAMGSFGLTRPQLMRQWRLLQKLQVVTSNRQSEVRNQNRRQLELPPTATQSEIQNLKSKIRNPALDYPHATKIKYELEILGMSATGHPLERPEPPDTARAANSNLQPSTCNLQPATRSACTPLAELGRHIGESVSIRGWLVTWRRIITKHGKLMMFVTLEDAGAVAEVTLFPTAYRRFGYVMEKAGSYLVSGKVDNHGNVEGRYIREDSSSS